MDLNRIRIRNLHPLNSFFTLFILSTSFILPQANWNTELLGRWGEGTCDAVEVDENFIYMGNGSYIDVYEDLEEPNFIVRLETPGIIRDILRVGDYLYVADEEYGLRIFNVSDINNSIEVGFLLPPSYTQKLLFRDNIIYSANYRGGLRIIDVENPAYPIEISSYESYEVIDLAIKDNFIFITAEVAFTVLDIADPHNPIFIKRIHTGGLCNGLAIQNNNLFVVTDWTTSIFSIVDPTNPIRKYITNEIDGENLSINNNYAFIPYNREINVVDISVPDTLIAVGQISSYGRKKSFRFKGNLMYIAGSYFGLVIIDITEINNPAYKYHIPSAYTTGYLVADKNFVYIANKGLRIIDVTDPYNPHLEGVAHTNSVSDKIFKKDNLVFLVDANINGLRIIDVKYPNYPLELSQIKPPHTFINSVTAFQDYLYIAQGDSLHVWDITAPSSPFHANTIHLLGYCDEIIIKDSLLVTCQDPGGIVIYNLVDPEHPQLVSSFVPEYRIQNLALQGNYIIGGASSGFEIIDITNPSLPFQVCFFSTPNLYDLAAVNNYLYIACSEIGIKVYDLNNISNPQEVGYYDTKGYAWSVDCWDDKIFVADSRYGMPIIRNTMLTSIDDQQTMPSTFHLSQNYPNPFNPTTTLEYSIPKSSFIKLSIYDLLGREIEMLVNQENLAGNYKLEFDGSNLSSGIYFYRLQADDYIETKKMLLLK